MSKERIALYRDVSVSNCENLEEIDLDDDTADEDDL